MNFQTLQKVEPYQRYLDIAFNTGKKRAESMKDIKSNSKINKSKDIELERMAVVRKTLNSHLMVILRGFPDFENLPAFYNELVKITIEYAALKKSLGGVGWALKKVDFFHRQYSGKIKKVKQIEKVNEYRRSFYGRICSVMRQIRKELMFLEEARRILKDFPAVKTSLKTVCIFGFPNVGKSTLLGKITGAKPEIKNYAFTTKNLNLGTLKFGEAGKKLQFIDTPGTLNRFNKMNVIEQQAYLALKHCCDVVVYVFDMTESYSFEKQYELLENLRKMKLGEKDKQDVPMIVYLSKTDLVEKEIVDRFIKEFRKKYEKIDVPVSDKNILVKNILKKIKIDAY